jgi:hypothetical protein
MRFSSLKKRCAARGRAAPQAGQPPPRTKQPTASGTLACSTSVSAAPDRRAIESQSLRLSANSLRPERRSTDGQVILKKTAGRSENRPDLLLCGAPLRNRTVDLLLTMHTSVGSLPGKHFPAGRRQAPIWLLPRPAASAIAQAIAPAAEQQLARVHAQRAQRPPAPGLPFKPGLWGCMPASHVHSDGQRTVRRSFLSRPPGPEDRAEQAFPHRQEKFEPVPLSAPRRKATGGSPGVLPSARSHPEHVEAQSQAAWPPERGR